MRVRPRIVVLGVLIAMVATGCSTDAGGGSAAPERGANVGSSEVDPQVLSDAIAGVFLMPGSEQRRTMRVWRYVDEAGLAACGRARTADAADLASTFDRVDQAHYADLTLIKQRGLTEPSTAKETNRERPTPECVRKALPHHDQWFALAGEWLQASKSAVQTSRVTATYPAITACLRAKSGLPVDPTDPTSTYLALADGGMSAGSDPARRDALMRRYSAVFVECTPAYFDALAAELSTRRAPLVERHREVLSAFGRDLVSAGYTP